MGVVGVLTDLAQIVLNYHDEGGGAPTPPPPYPPPPGQPTQHVACGIVTFAGPVETRLLVRRIDILLVISLSVE